MTHSYFEMRMVKWTTWPFYVPGDWSQ